METLRDGSSVTEEFITKRTCHACCHCISFNLHHLATHHHHSTLTHSRTPHAACQYDSFFLFLASVRFPRKTEQNGKENSEDSTKGLEWFDLDYGNGLGFLIAETKTKLKTIIIIIIIFTSP